MAENDTCGIGGCGCSTEKTGSSEKGIVAQTSAARNIEIEFLYLDLDVCEMCRGTESNLEEALTDVSEVLKLTGVQVTLKKTHITSYEQALTLDFISSPTIRINGRDVALEVKENYCSSCSALSGTDTFCRVWNFGGQEFSSVPKSLVIETVLKEIYGAGREGAEISAERKTRSRRNLKRFFSGVETKEPRIEEKSEKAAISLPVSSSETTGQSSCGCS